MHAVVSDSNVVHRGDDFYQGWRQMQSLNLNLSFVHDIQFPTS